jgi:hypothetical protein
LARLAASLSALRCSCLDIISPRSDGLFDQPAPNLRFSGRWACDTQKTMHTPGGPSKVTSRRAYVVGAARVGRALTMLGKSDVDKNARGVKAPTDQLTSAVRTGQLSSYQWCYAVPHCACCHTMHASYILSGPRREKSRGNTVSERNSKSW